MKRAGHLLSKMRFVSAQLDAYISNDVWLRNAKHANKMGKRLSEGLVIIQMLNFHIQPRPMKFLQNFQEI